MTMVGSRSVAKKIKAESHRSELRWQHSAPKSLVVSVNRTLVSVCTLSHQKSRRMGGSQCLSSRRLEVGRSSDGYNDDLAVSDHFCNVKVSAL